MHILDLDGVLCGRKIYIGSGRASLLLVFGGLRYRHLVGETEIPPEAMVGLRLDTQTC
jgi:hypothetical protein